MNNDMSAIARVSGFRAVGVTCGLKDSGKPDVALVLADRPCTAAAVFTKNLFKAAPVLYDMALMEHSSKGIWAVIINAGNANALTGEQGRQDAEQMARLVESSCELPPNSVFVMSTGVTGEPLPMDKITAGIQQASERIETEAGQRGVDAAQAIMTTDLVPKEAFTQTSIGGQTVSIGGMAKGSGMIHPDMATLLSVIATDARIESDVLNQALTQAVNRSFNRITVDGDTSTNDTVLVLASGRADHTEIAPNTLEYEAFVAALSDVCVQLARAIARDGEGATKLIEITVLRAATEDEAETAAKTIATSPLVKTALFGNDPNWGRVLAAAGRSGVRIDPAKVALWLGDYHLVEAGEPLDFDQEAAHNWLAGATEVAIVIELGVGQAQVTVWTCDLSYKYVEINAEYHT